MSDVTPSTANGTTTDPGDPTSDGATPAPGSNGTETSDAGQSAQNGGPAGDGKQEDVAPEELAPEHSDRYSAALRRFSGDLRMARQVWRSMDERDVERHPVHHRLYLDALLAANEVDAASAHLEAMQAAGIPTDDAITWRLALARARSGVAGASEQLDELARTTPPPPSVLPRLFGIQVRAGRLGPAKATMRRMSTEGVRASDDEYRPLLHDIMERNAIKDAEALVEHLLAVDAPPSQTTAANLVTMMAESGHPDRGEQLAETLVSGGVTVRPEAHEAIVDGWANANDLRATRRAISQLQEAGGEPNSHHRNLVLATIAGHGDLEGAWQEALDMLDVGIPSGDNLDRMLELALKRRDVALSLSAWDWMVMLGVPPSPHRAAELVGVVLRDGQLDVAMGLYRELVRLEVTPDRRRGAELAAALVDADRLDEARALLNELRVRKVVTKGRAWGPLLGALARRNRTKELVELVADMVGHGIPPTVSDASRTVGALTRSKQLDEARSLLATLAEAGVTVDEPSYRELLWAFARKGRADQAKEVLDAMTDAGITPDERHEKAIAWATGETQRRLPDDHEPDDAASTPVADPPPDSTPADASPDVPEAAVDGRAPAPTDDTGTEAAAAPTDDAGDEAGDDAPDAPTDDSGRGAVAAPTDGAVERAPADEARPAATGGAKQVVDSPDPVVTSGDDDAGDAEGGDPDDATATGAGAAEPTPEPGSPEAEAEAPIQPDLADGTATPDPDKSPPADGPGDGGDGGRAPSDPADEDAMQGEASDGV